VVVLVEVVEVVVEVDVEVVVEVDVDVVEEVDVDVDVVGRRVVVVSRPRRSPGDGSGGRAPFHWLVSVSSRAPQRAAPGRAGGQLGTTASTTGWAGPRSRATAVGTATAERVRRATAAASAFDRPP
jgi:hypothetical protein